MEWNPDAGELTLHQSDIKHYMTCPEQFRLSYLGDLRNETDAALVGTTLHAVIEHELASEPFKTANQACRWAVVRFHDSINHFNSEGMTYLRGSFKTDEKAEHELKELVRVWYRSAERHDLLSGAVDFQCEWKFHQFLGVTHVGSRAVDVYLAGQADIVTPTMVVDWKSAGRAYQRWEKQRWDPQPPVYTWAAWKAGILKPNDDGKFDFKFKVFVRGSGEIQTVNIQTSQGKFGWITEQSIRIASMVCDPEMVERPWPLRDDHALCGPKWCPAWDICKGSYVDADKDWT